jgi:hypothetical protein
MNNYGQRVRGFVVPRTNGNYTFWIASDDTSVLLLSTNENPAGKAVIAYVSSWTSLCGIRRPGRTVTARAPRRYRPCGWA